jgi:tRNA(fMet)-specific endonuclease VapC
MLKFLLDTNIIIYTLKNRPERVRAAFNSNSGQMAISSVTFMELVYGCERSIDPARNLREVEGMAARLDVLPFDDSAALQAGQIRAELSKAGKPIGPYDVMIAGHARSLGLIVVTNNQQEFKRVPGLRLENWTR